MYCSGSVLVSGRVFLFSGFRMILTSSKQNAKKVFKKHHENPKLIPGEAQLARSEFLLTFDDRVMSLWVSPSECRDIANMFEMAYIQHLKKPE